MATPSSQTFPCLAQRVKPLDIQAFVSQPSIETFNEPVLYRAAGADEAKLHTMPDGPDLERAAGVARDGMGVIVVPCMWLHRHRGWIGYQDALRHLYAVQC